MSSDDDPWDQECILSEERTAVWFFRIKGCLECLIASVLAYATYGDLLWSETSTTDLDDAHEFADGIHEKYPDKMLS